METWHLEHPEVGTIEVQRGYDAEFVEMGQWPKKAKDFTPVPGDATLLERLRLWRKNPSPRLQIVVNLSLIHISEPTRRLRGSRMPSSA